MAGTQRGEAGKAAHRAQAAPSATLHAGQTLQQPCAPNKRRRIGPHTLPKPLVGASTKASAASVLPAGRHTRLPSCVPTHTTPPTSSRAVGSPARWKSGASGTLVTAPGACSWRSRLAPPAAWLLLCRMVCSAPSALTTATSVPPCCADSVQLTAGSSGAAKRSRAPPSRRSSHTLTSWSRSWLGAPPSSCHTRHREALLFWCTSLFPARAVPSARGLNWKQAGDSPSTPTSSMGANCSTKHSGTSTAMLIELRL